MTNFIMIFYILWIYMIIIFLIIMILPLHPIMLMITLISFNMLLIINMAIYQPLYLYSIMFFIIMISGLLIIFLYFSSLISNEKNFTFLLNFKTSIFIAITISMMMYLIILNNYNYNELTNTFTEMLSNSYMNELFINFLKPKLNIMYSSSPLNNMALLSMTFLLITLLTIIKICSPKMKSMRKSS